MHTGTYQLLNATRGVTVFNRRSFTCSFFRSRALVSAAEGPSLWQVANNCGACLRLIADRTLPAPDGS